MGVLAQKAKFKVATPTIRVEKVVLDVSKPKKPLSRTTADRSNGVKKSHQSLRASSGSPRPSPSSLSSRLRHRASASPLPISAVPSSSLSSSPVNGSGQKRKASSVDPGATARASSARKSPASDRVAFDEDSGSEDDEDWEESLDSRKRQRRADCDRLPDPKRRLVSSTLTDPPPDGKEVRLIHASEVASLKLKCSPSLGAPASEVAIKLQYPGLPQRERYELVSGKDMIDAVAEIIRVVKAVAETYLTDEEARPFLDPTNGIVRQLERASSPSVLNYKAFKSAVESYNSQLLALQKKGAIARNLAQNHTLPSHLVAFILDQVYDRTVAPKVELLAKYENGTDNVYGELLHPFIYDILVRRTRMTSGQVFVDLGSGVGNVVLQAALDIGCESWGCEMMENACNLAEAQKREFSARCRLWGIAPGKVRLERGDFRSNERIHEALKRADVVLVNNQAFTSQLNDDLVRMFLDLKSGCKIISLKSFAHDQKNAANDVGSTILDVEHLTYPEGCVSWTGAGGTFCISTRK